MKKKSSAWGYAPAKSTFTAAKKELYLAKLETFLETEVGPKIKPAPQDNPHHFNYMTGVSARAKSKFLYITAQWASPHPKAIAPTFETSEFRLEFVGNDRFAVAYMRHTEKFFTISTDLSFDQALECIRELPHFNLFFV
jgi:hypothetical protein